MYFKLTYQSAIYIISEKYNLLSNSIIVKNYVTNKSIIISPDISITNLKVKTNILNNSIYTLLNRNLTTQNNNLKTNFGYRCYLYKYQTKILLYINKNYLQLSKKVCEQNNLQKSNDYAYERVTSEKYNCYKINSTPPIPFQGDVKSCKSEYFFQRNFQTRVFTKVSPIINIQITKTMLDDPLFKQQKLVRIGDESITYYLGNYNDMNELIVLNSKISMISIRQHKSINIYTITKSGKITMSKPSQSYISTSHNISECTILDNPVDYSKINQHEINLLINNKTETKVLLKKDTTSPGISELFEINVQSCTDTANYLELSAI